MIVSAGIVRMAVLGASTWIYCGLGTGTTTSDIGDIDLESIVGNRKLFQSATASLFTSYFKTIFAKADSVSASNITEIAIFDSSVAGAGNTCFRTVASTNTWTAFLKSSSVVSTISTQLAFST